MKGEIWWGIRHENGVMSKKWGKFDMNDIPEKHTF
jgi:hypothetical protein